MKKKIYEYFAHPVFKYKVKDYSNHNKLLEKYIYQLQKEDPKGQQRSNLGGWHSPFFDLNHSFTNVVISVIYNCITSRKKKYFYG